METELFYRKYIYYMYCQYIEYSIYKDNMGTEVVESEYQVTMSIVMKFSYTNGSK